MKLYLFSFELMIFAMFLFSRVTPGGLVRHEAWLAAGGALCVLGALGCVAAEILKLTLGTDKVSQDAGALPHLEWPQLPTLHPASKTETKLTEKRTA